ncbi:hypothetical protein ONZ45_g7904 [Pleurotus djamor]|nr:hypothetical protein ONZ45_g7904 [Pleurotus djamor]
MFSFMKPFILDVTSPSLLFIGLFMAIALYGAILVQVYAYLHLSREAHKADHVWVPLTVAYLVLMETGMIIYSMVMMYKVIDCEWDGLLHPDGSCAQNRYGDAPVFGVQFMIDNVMRTNGLLTALVSTAVQCSMAWRVRVLSQSNILGGSIVLISSLSLGFGIAAYAEGTRIMEFLPGYASGRDDSYKFPFVWLLSSAITDTIIAVSFIVILVRAIISSHDDPLPSVDLKTQRRTGFSRTDGMLTRMTQLGTGALTAILTILDAALFLHGMLHHSEDNFTAYTIPEFLLSKLYTNSLLATLNARIVWRDSSSDVQSGSGNASALMPSFRMTRETISSTSAVDTSCIGPNEAKKTSRDEAHNDCV